MMRGIEKRRVVEDEQDRRDFVRRLGKLASETMTIGLRLRTYEQPRPILLSGGPRDLAKFMRRFLTGYAVSYKFAHRRHGHVFQKSVQIDCV